MESLKFIIPVVWTTDVKDCAFNSNVIKSAVLLGNSLC